MQLINVDEQTRERDSHAKRRAAHNLAWCTAKTHTYCNQQ
jgi:hypothetical protein